MSAQVAMSGLEDPDQEAADLEAEIESARMWREQLYAACRACVRDLGGYEVVANRLDAIWGALGKERTVSATFLRAALNDTNRNQARIEWLHYFKQRSKDVAQLMASGCKPTKTDKELLADLEAEMREELSHKAVERLMRKAKSR